jgi:hypothetical protein
MIDYQIGLHVFFSIYFELFRVNSHSNLKFHFIINSQDNFYSNSVAERHSWIRICRKNRLDFILEVIILTLFSWFSSQIQDIVYLD